MSAVPPGPSVDRGDDEVRVAGFADLDPTVGYRLWRLRVDVFVVEQECAYAELDGRDLEPATRHLWVQRDGEPVGYLRVLTEPDTTHRIGRVCVARLWRGRGLAEQLIRRALQEIGAQACVLDAQAHLAGWYARFGFEQAGAEFVEDGIPHVPMALSEPATRRGRSPATG